ncbi:MAG: TonB-dependent receptor plug domain-containing protein [Bacteroidales bacterium]|nr:TonB-dependent receptor plug domain-containing protein [Bacteroidales bacterium]
MLRITGILIACLLLAGSSLSQGIEDSVFVLETVEIKASQAQKPEEAGMRFNRVDSLVMIRNLDASLAGLLSENTSVFVKEMGRGALATASFRGTAASHTRVNWNGMPMNSPMTGMVDFSLVPVYISDEISLAFGPAALEYGSGGVGGSVNINNTVDWHNVLNVKFIQGIGSYSTFDEFLQFGIGNRKVQSKTRLYHNYSKNDYTFINRGIAEIDPETGQISNPKDTNENADYMQFGLLQELYLRAGERNTFSARYWFQQSGRTIPRATSYEGPEHSNMNRQDNTDHRLMGEWKNFGEEYQLSVRSGYTSKKLDYELKNFVPGLGEIPAVYSESRIKSSLNRVSVNYNFIRGLMLEGIADLNYHSVATVDSVKKTGYEGDRTEFLFYLSVSKRFWERFDIKVSLRQDFIAGKASPLIPYFGFRWKVLEDKELFIRGNISRNYQEPTLNDLYWQPGGNPALLPEKGYSTELGLDYAIDLGKQRIKGGLTAYLSDIADWIIWIPSYKGYWEPRNISKVKARGLEADLLLEGITGKVSYRLAGNYAYTSSKNYGDPVVWGDESYGKQLVYIPLHSGNLMVNLGYGGFYATYRFNAYSERFTTSSNDVSRRDWLYPYYMNDLYFGKNFRLGKISLGAEIRIYNLFDETYHTVLYRPMPGRNYMIMLKFSFEK